MIDVPQTPPPPREQDRLTTQGRSTDDGSFTTLLVIHESDGSWAIHNLGAPRIRLARADMVAVCEAILERARWAGTCVVVDRRRWAGAR